MQLRADAALSLMFEPLSRLRTRLHINHAELTLMLALLNKLLTLLLANPNIRNRRYN